jgi:hypothetical protein
MQLGPKEDTNSNSKIEGQVLQHKDHLLMPLNTSWQSFLFKFQFQSLNSRVISEHLIRINRYLEQPAAPLIELINNDAFWNNLKAFNGYDEKAATLEKQWKALRPLMHLNTQELLTLLQEEIAPLILSYEGLLADLNDDKSKLAGNGQWRPKCFKATLDKTISDIEKNRLQLNNLTDLIHQHLLLRCQTHEVLKTTRNVDDLMAHFASDINSLPSVKKPLNTSEPSSATLNDDRRLIIFDILKKTTNDFEKLKKAVLDPIPRIAQLGITSKAEVDNKLLEITEFCKKIAKDIDFVKKKMEITFLQWSYYKLGKKHYESATAKLSGALAKLFGIEYIPGLYLIKYALYLYVSMTVYQHLILLLRPIIISLFPVAITSFITLGLFVTIGLAPITLLAVKWGLRFQSEIYKVLTYGKRESIFDSLSLLKETQLFIAAKLSHPVIDIPHYDCEHLRERAVDYVAQLNKCKERLNHFNAIEKLLYGAATKKAISEINETITTKEKEINEHLKLVAANIAKRVGDDIDVLERNINDNKLQVLLPPNQLCNLQKFVLQYGTKKDQEDFNAHSDVISHWVSKIENLGLCYAHSKPNTLNIPWGGLTVLPSAVEGWGLLLQSFAANLAQKEACARLIALLKGEKVLTVQEMNEYVFRLGKGAQSAPIVTAIQNFLYKTFRSQNPQIASLLTAEHIQSINQWYEANKKQITEANDTFSNIFASFNRRDPSFAVLLNSINDEKLSRYYELLDAEDVYLAANGLPGNDKPRNLAREFFAKYQGEHSRAYSLIRLVPKHEQEGLVSQLAQKRLTWILANLDMLKESDPFEGPDVQLFHDPWLTTKTHFDFSEIVKKSPQFEVPNSPKMQNFLKVCAAHLFDSKKLMNIYQENAKKPELILIKQTQSLVAPKQAINLTSNPEEGKKCQLK